MSKRCPNLVRFARRVLLILATVLCVSVAFVTTTLVNGQRSDSHRASTTTSAPHQASVILETGTVEALGNYPNTTTGLSSNITVTPDAQPTTTTRIDVSTDTNFKGILSADPTTGIVQITNAHPAGTYTLTLKGFDAVGNITTQTFTLTVNNPSACGGAMLFRPVANFAVGSTPFSVAVADLNGDSKQDLAAANVVSGNVSILPGAGTGNFGPATSYSTGVNPEFLAFGDFNGDGDQDIAVPNLSSNTVTVRLGNGSGSLGGATNYTTAPGPVAVAVSDFNGDGKQDLVTANQSSNNVSVFLGSGTGGFNAPTNFAAGPEVFSVTVGDFNNDGIRDLVTANALTGANSISVLLGTGTGALGAPTNFTVGNQPAYVAIGNFNGDSAQDLVTANSNGNDVSVLLGTGTGSFGAATNFTAGSRIFYVATGDFNSDGIQDIAAANFGGSSVAILLGTGTGTFGAPASFSVGNTPTAVAVGDFNGDGKQDIASANQGSDNVSVLVRACSTAARVSVTGHVLTADGRGIRSAVVTLTDGSGVGQQVRISARGEYQFSDVGPGQTYILSVESRRFRFAPRVITVNDDLTGIDIVADQ